MSTQDLSLGCLQQICLWLDVYSKTQRPGATKIGYSRWKDLIYGSHSGMLISTKNTELSNEETRELKYQLLSENIQPKKKNI